MHDEHYEERNPDIDEILQSWKWYEDDLADWEQVTAMPVAMEVQGLLLKHDYALPTCVRCGKVLELHEEVWWVEALPYCEHCAGEVFMRTVEVDEINGCYECGNDIPSGEDIWEFPNEYPMCDDCAEKLYRLPVWVNHLKET